MTAPTPVNPDLAYAAVEDFFAQENWRRRIAECDWGMSQVDPLTVIVALRARPLADNAATYTLRLSCAYYPSHPPDVRFVNPQTLMYDPAIDCCHLPVLQAPYCYLHPIYGYQNPYEYGPQLVCNSLSLGYYFSGHNPTPDQRWQPGKHSIGTSIQAVYRALHSPYYLGRQPA